jgi:hypothetical protein
MPQRLKKFISCLLVVAFFATTLSVFVGNACAAGVGQEKHGHVVGKLVSVDKETPCCPCDDDDSSSGHCNSFCSCACHAHLPSQLLQAVFSKIVTPLQFLETFKAIPEVYLPKFIPPHILA